MTYLLLTPVRTQTTTKKKIWGCSPDCPHSAPLLSNPTFQTLLTLLQEWDKAHTLTANLTTPTFTLQNCEGESAYFWGEFGIPREAHICHVFHLDNTVTFDKISTMCCHKQVAFTQRLSGLVNWRWNYVVDIFFLKRLTRWERSTSSH